mgnify:CR=1 FL=1
MRIAARTTLPVSWRVIVINGSQSPVWHALPSEQCLQLLEAQTAGLSDEAAQQRLQQFGPNSLPPRQGIGPLKRFALQFHNLLIYVLLASGLVTLLLKGWLDSAVIFAVVLINAVVGFIQEGKAEQAMRAIQQPASYSKPASESVTRLSLTE